MQTNLEKVLLTTAPADWKVRQVIIFDWYDGPREGVCELSSPEVSFYFEILAEQRLGSNFGDRLFTVSELGAGGVRELIEVFRGSGSPTSPVWAPHGAYASEEEQQRIEEAVARLTSPRRATRVLIRTRDMVTIAEVWMDTRASSL